MSTRRSPVPSLTMAVAYSKIFNLDKFGKKSNLKKRAKKWPQTAEKKKIV